MTEIEFGEAIDEAIAEAMAEDERVLFFGEDVRTLHAPLFMRFGPDRVLDTPISEAAFVGAAVAAAMGGLRPVVEVMLVDFVGTAMDAVLNQMAKNEAFSGGRWKVPLVLRAACGGGYGDGGQHEQALWGLLGGIPGLDVVVPSGPLAAAGLMKAAIDHEGPVVLLEHKLLSNVWLESMGRGGRSTVQFDVPQAATRAPRPAVLDYVPLRSARVKRAGDDVSLVSLAVGVHRCLAAAEALQVEGVSCEVIDLQSVRPLDASTLVGSLQKTGRLVVVDEDYRECGVSGELAALALEAGLAPRFRRVCCQGVIPYDRRREEHVLPTVRRIVRAVHEVLAEGRGRH